MTLLQNAWQLWKRRHEFADATKVARDADFLPPARSIVARPTSPYAHWMAWSICLLFAVFFAWSYFGEVDIVAVGQGRIVASRRTQVVQPLETGTVRAIRVKDGDQVAQGDVLVELDATSTQADVNKLIRERSEAESDLRRYSALLARLKGPVRQAVLPSRRAEDAASAEALRIETDWRAIRDRMDKLAVESEQRNAQLLTAAETVRKMAAILPLTKQREHDFEALVGQGFISSHSLQDKARDRVETERELSIAEARYNEALMAKRDAEREALLYRSETIRSLEDKRADAEASLSRVLAELQKATQKHRAMTLVSPVSGTVQQLAVHSLGGVVTPAQSLLYVVPDDADVVAEIRLENKDVGFVRAGQSADVKFDAFPYTRYGAIAATVGHVSADAVADEQKGSPYTATLILKGRLLRVDGKDLPIGPGLAVAVDIRTGRRKVIDFLLSPLQATVDNSFHER